MLKDLPVSLIQAAAEVLEKYDVLDSCACGAQRGSCFHTFSEDTLSKSAIADEDTPEKELSGETEDVVINPEYKTHISRGFRG